MGSEFWAIWEDHEGGFIKFAVKRALKQDQTLHMEGKLHVILYFRAVWSMDAVKRHPNLIFQFLILNPDNNTYLDQIENT